MSEHAETIARLVDNMRPLTEAEAIDLHGILSPAVAAVLERQPKRRPQRPAERRRAA